MQFACAAVEFKFKFRCSYETTGHYQQRYCFIHGPLPHQCFFHFYYFLDVFQNTYLSLTNCPFIYICTVVNTFVNFRISTIKENCIHNTTLYNTTVSVKGTTTAPIFYHCLLCPRWQSAFTRGGRAGSERHRELSAEELQPLFLHSQRLDLLLQPPVLLLQLVEGLQHANH